MTLRGLVLATVAALAAVPATAFAQAPPENDHYLGSLRVNDPNTSLPRDRVADTQDTTAATVQADIFNPPQSGGPAEPTVCPTPRGDAPFGNTVWYDFYPHRSSIAKINVSAVAFDPVIGVFEFNPSNALPRGGTCIDDQDLTSEELLVPVLRGRAYTVQIGGYNFTGGAMQALFEFLRLPTVDASPTLRARPTSSGIRVSSLRVDAPRGARVEVTCTRRACRRQARTAAKDFVGYQRVGRVEFGGPQAEPSASWSKNGDGGSSVEPRANSSRVVSFRNVRRSFRSGQRIRIKVTQQNTIGRFIEYRVVRGNFKRTNRCIEPGSSRPRSCRGL